jgi:pseudolysin
MFPINQLPKLLGLVVFLFLNQAWSAEKISWHSARISNINNNLQSLPLSPGKHLMSAVNKNSGEYLSLVSSHKDANKINHVRLQQMYQGVPVFGGYVIVHTNKKLQNKLKELGDAHIQGILYENLSKDLGDLSPDFIKHKDLVLAKLKQRYADDVIVQESITPIVYLDKNHTAIWAYRASFSLQKAGGEVSQPNFIVSYKNDELVFSWEDLKTLKTIAQAQGYGGNHKIGKFFYGETSPTLHIMRDDTQGICYLENDVAKVIHSDDLLIQGEWLSIAEMPGMSFNCVDPLFASPSLYWTGIYNDGLDEVNGGYSPSNDALFYGEVVQRMYKSWYNTDVLLDWYGNPSSLIMIVHDKDYMDNAAWDGAEIVLGDGDDNFYPMVSLNIIAHEASHGFTQMHSNLIYFSHSGALNESFSDMAAQTAEYYLYGKASWMVGQDILKEQTNIEAVRYMDKPSRDKHSIDNADDFYVSINVHRGSGVFHRLFYLLSNHENWTPRQAFHVMLKANMDYWTPFSNFDDALCGAEFAAADLGYNVDDVIWAGEQVHINVNCGDSLS